MIKQTAMILETLAKALDDAAKELRRKEQYEKDMVDSAEDRQFDSLPFLGKINVHKDRLINNCITHFWSDDGSVCVMPFDTPYRAIVSPIKVITYINRVGNIRFYGFDSLEEAQDYLDKLSPKELRSI